MARLLLSPTVANRFVTLDWREGRGDPKDFSRKVIGRYEAGDVIILKHAPFRIDYDLLNQVSLPAGRLYQKLGDRTLTYPKLHRPDVAKLFLRTFLHRPVFYFAFRREVKKVSNQLRTFAREVFAPYRFQKMGVSWRFTPTGPEGLHVDHFRRDEDLHYVRIFVNIDVKPRVWTVSHQLGELINRFYDEAGLDELRAAHSREICNRLNKAVFERSSQLPADALDRHVVEFAQGDVWLCETRINSHEIFAGHRLVATDFYVDPHSMLDPSLRVEAQVRHFFEHCAAVRNVA